MKKVITFGEIMLRLSPPDHQRFSQASSFGVLYGGSESNVAVSLANFGVPVSFVTRLPDNDMGKAAEKELKKYGVETDDIIHGGERLGIYFVEKGAVNRGSNVIYDRSHSAFSSIEQTSIDWEEIFKDAQWFHWSGITPAISQNAADVCLEAIKAAKDFDLTISTDLNYRSKLWNYGKAPDEVMPKLVKKCDLMLAGRYAAKQFFGIEPEDGDLKNERDRHRSLCQKLMDHFPKVKKVAVTLREAKNASHHRWTGMLYDGDEYYESPTYDITHIVDRVGGGDAFMGGLIYGLLNYSSDRKALDFAVAASCLKHTIPGDVNLATVSEVEQLMAGNTEGRVSR